MKSNTLTDGAIIGNRFLIEATAASGGMGTIFRARDLHTDGLVALKILHQLGTQIDEVVRFSREAQVLASLRHPGIVSYVAHGQTPDGHYYLAMEWLEGEDLARRLSRQPLNLVESLLIARCVAEALIAAHNRSFLHRDIKPSNLFLRSGRVDQVVLLDFGIARHAMNDFSMTRTGLVIGTPDYMSPEQARGDRDIAQSADVYSLGCVLFECLTGKPPFSGLHVAALIAKILFEDPPKLRSLRPEMPASVEALLDSMLAKDRTQRPADGAALLTALDALEVDVKSVSGLPPQVRVLAPIVMAGAEQRWVSVILAEETTPEHQMTIDVHEQVRRQTHDTAVSQGLASYGARAEWLPTGALVATISQSGNANDQAIQAARCALAIKSRWPEACVTLTTGRGLVHDRLLVGEAIDRAAALLRSAVDLDRNSAGRVILDDVTARLLDTRFDVRELDSGIIVLHAERTSIDEVRTLLGKPTMCLGRERELGTLENTLSECVEEATARVVLVIAPAGMGKSRLRIEFLRRLRAQHPEVQVLSGRGDQMTAGSVYWILGQALRQLCNAHEGDPLPQNQAKLSARVAQTVPAADVERVAEFLGELCGIPFADSTQLRAARQDPRIMSDQVTRAFQDFLRCECTQRPVLLLFEDLHWGDLLTVKLIDLTLRELTDLPFMVVALARPEVEELFPKLWAERNRTDIRMAGLNKKIAERLVQQSLDARVTPQAMSRIVEQAAGNALYLEELIRAFAEGKGDELPETVLAMMQARILRLDAGARRVLRAAAIFGETFWRSGVVRLLGQDRSTGALEVWFQSLIEAEVIEAHRTSRFTSESEYGFRHALMRDAAYSMLTDDDRKIGHRLAGEYLVGIGDSNSILLAEHFLLGGDVERAVTFFARAAEQSYESNDLLGAVKRAQRGIDCGAESESLGALQSIQGSAYSFLGDMHAAYAIGNRSLDILPSGSLRWCKACGMLFLSGAVIGEHEAMMALAQRFGEIEPQPDARAAYVEAASVVLVMCSLIGLRAPAKFFLARMMKVSAASMASDAAVRAWVLYGHSRYLDALAPAPFTASNLARQAVAAFDEVGDRRMTAVAHGDLGTVLAELLQIKEAEATLRAGLALGLRIHEPMAIVWNQLFLALALAEYGTEAQLDEVSVLADEVIAVVGSSSVYGGKVLCARARAQLRRGQPEQAEQDGRSALASMSVMPTMVPSAYAVLVEALLQQGRSAEARALAADGMRVVSSLGGTGGTELRLRRATIKALQATGETAAAKQAIQEAQAQLDARAADIADETMRAQFLAHYAI